MKNLSLFCIALQILATTSLSSQEKDKPFIVSLFIGEKLDRIEEDYFNLFPVITNFQEATFYLKSDSSLMVNIKGYYHDVFIDSTMPCLLTLNKLRNSIDQIILKDIVENKVQKLEFKTISDSTYEGTVYLFNEDKIKLIKQDYLSKNYLVDENDFFEILDYSNVKSITNFEKVEGLTGFGAIIGMVAGGLLGYALAPEPYIIKPTTLGEWLMNPDGTEVNYESLYTIIGILLGGVIGYGIGNAIKIPIEIDIMDPEAKGVIKANSLLPSGIKNN